METNYYVPKSVNDDRKDIILRDLAQNLSLEQLEALERLAAHQLKADSGREYISMDRIVNPLSKVPAPCKQSFDPDEDQDDFMKHVHNAI